MPEMRFAVRWPDGAETSHYSPSLVMHDFLVTGGRYPVQEFVSRTTEALEAASARVREKYGFACTSAMASQESITANAAGYRDGEVTVLSMEPPLPGGAA
ncbi:MSMEG_0570 family nitrogen starvation response protein [Microbacterium sp. SORGH_AS_0888]|uniref:MSMEG_0570 family nitrogen starvation response protein n=1 Tax=Microbacterium sp. SORGH_AS_0888 TaxID=3041791 RepID=UPI00277F08D8|nr:MSMEG_0570 family nitrogen starvation response protein [Microbacterium sp. SORGH_AS_0888]MDQ1129198.1 putative repeat protein (TIGR04042 family) [Microbacterium sp. SORGH_AS_0888]